MKVVYIAGPYRAKTPWKTSANIRAAGEVGLKYSKMGYAAIGPQMNTAHMDGELPDQFWLDSTMALMKKCDIVVMMKNWKESEGARNEQKEAIDSCMEIVYDDGIL